MSENSELRENVVPKYFRQTPKSPSYVVHILLMVFGGLSALGGAIAAIVRVSDDSGILCCGIPFLLGGGVLAFMGFAGFFTTKSKYKREYDKAEPKPSDTQMDGWLNEDLERIKRESLEKLDLIPEQVREVMDPNDPLTVVGPASEARWAKGKDDILRFSLYDILVVYLTSYHLAAYQCKLDLATGTLLSESTQEYHYTDVVSVATQAASSGLIAIMADGKKEEISSYQKFALSVASGQSIAVAVSFPQLEDMIKEGKLAATGADKAISTIRTMLREKKGGVQA